MKCWHCKTELIWGGDHNIEDENKSYSMVTNLSCPHCDCYVEVYYPSGGIELEMRSDGLYQPEEKRLPPKPPKSPFEDKE